MDARRGLIRMRPLRAALLASALAAAACSSAHGQIQGPATALTVGSTVVNGGSNGQCLYINAGTVGVNTCGMTTITVDTTTITGGTTTRVLYDNAGVIGEYTNVQLTALIGLATTALSGALPAWPNTTNTFFRGDGTYAQPSFSNLSGTPTTLAGYGITNGALNTRLLNTTAPITGGGDLTADRTLACATCATTTNGGAITGTGPVAVSVAGAISITGVAGQVLAGAGPAFTATPTLGASGTLGSVTLGNATSGLLTLQPVTGALGTVTLSLPAATDTLVGKATTDTLTNKTYDTAGAGNSFLINGTAITAVSGTGSAVLSASPTFTGTVTSPALTLSNAGTLSAPALALSNCGANCGLVATAAGELQVSILGLDRLNYNVTIANSWYSPSPFGAGGVFTAYGAVNFTAASIGVKMGGTNVNYLQNINVAGTLQLGQTDVDTNASIVAQTLRTQGTLAGGTADQAGKDFTLGVSPGKGTGAGGIFHIATAPAGTTGTAVNALVDALLIDSKSHLRVGATTAPALTSCGTGSPTILGTDIAGTAATGCVITFNKAYANTPFCTVTWQGTPLLSQSFVVSASAITLTQTSTSGDIINYVCMSQNAG